MYITILDNSVKKVFMYDYMGDLTVEGHATDQGINQVLTQYQHDITQCNFMVHDNPRVNKRLFHNHHNDDLITQIYE